MRQRVLIWAGAWLILITLAHVWLNIGWNRFSHSVQVRLGNEREELIVGFLPVT